MHGEKSTMFSLQDLKSSRKRLGRIRCLQDCINCFNENKPLPEAICYVPAEVEYKTVKTTNAPVSVVVQLYSEPNLESEKHTWRTCPTDTRLIVSGEEYCNGQGQWAQLRKLIKPATDKEPAEEEMFDKKLWMLLFEAEGNADKPPNFQAVLPSSHKPEPKELIYGKQATTLQSWDEVVEHTYSLQLNKEHYTIAPVDVEARDRLQNLPANWLIDHNEDLANFLGGHVEVENEHLGCIKNYVESIEVSSFCDEDGVGNLTDGDPDTYWESDGSQGQHWIRLRMKKGTIIKKLFVTVDGRDENFLPYRIHVMAGEIDNLKNLSDITISQSVYGVQEVCILSEQNKHHQIIEIRIKECKADFPDDGIDTRIHGIRIVSTKERNLGLSRDTFASENLVRFPKLEGFNIDILYRRAIVLQRFVQLLDSVLPYIVPAWEYSIGSYSSLEYVRQFLPLSKKRLSLIETFLGESETGRPSRMPKLYINRRTAAEHKSDPTKDPDYKNSVFYQMYEGLKPKDRNEKPLDYRWPNRYDQWWECKFVSEGIIDQGGGFRDSLSDLADELCPSASDIPVPLPFFIRSPNQSQVDSNVNRDVYIPNPSCKEFQKYEWIGKVMGACLRGKENLVLTLASIVWKKLVGERVTWNRDYVTVNEAEVKMIENMYHMDEESFDAYFEGERTWTTVLSDGSVVPLKEHGADMTVNYSERNEYCNLVQEAHMNEFQQQVDAMRRGLLQVVPQAVLDLLTWQELERRICGDPDITMEALKRTTHYEDLEETDTRVKYLWEALSNFSNEDRSRFLRFVTGRRRLPAPLYICPEKGESVDALPESSTCSNTLYLPYYTSAKKAENKLRYAAYNCLAIDTDMSPWDE